MGVVGLLLGKLLNLELSREIKTPVVRRGIGRGVGEAGLASSRMGVVIWKGTSSEIK